MKRSRVLQSITSYDILASFQRGESFGNVLERCFVHHMSSKKCSNPEIYGHLGIHDAYYVSCTNFFSSCSCFDLQKGMKWSMYMYVAWTTGDHVIGRWSFHNNNWLRFCLRVRWFEYIRLRKYRKKLFVDECMGDTSQEPINQLWSPRHSIG